MSNRPGEIVSHYRILQKLGEGGMGEVYLAEDTKLDRKVALKFLPGSLWNESEARERLIREAKAASKLDHPNVVTIFGIDEHEGRPFISMAHVPGVTLREFCTAKKRTTAELLDLAIQMTDGLQHAHEAGVVHRDLKPSNVIVDDRGRARILDFGIASLRGAAKLTQTGSTVGTLAYAPPELAQGRPAEPVSDIYSLGVVIYQMLSGRLPFEADHEAALLYSILHEQPKPLSEVMTDPTPAIARVVEKCLQKQPELRYRSCTELATALKAARPREDSGTTTAATNRPSLAVLPFANMSADPENEFFSDGLSEELLNVMARNPGLKVTGRTSSFAFKGKQLDLREIGQKLGVETLLEGSVRKSGNRVRITAQLVKTSDGFHLWSSTYDRVLEDVFAVQDEIAGEVAGALNVALLGQRRSQVVRNPEVYSLILQGNYLGSRNSQESLREAERTFRRALQLDPEAAEAWAGLSHAHLMMAGFGHDQTKGATEQAKEMALRAVEIDDQCLRAHIHLSRIHLTYDYDWDLARLECDRAEAIAPGDTQVMYARAAIHAVLDHPAQSLPLLHRAIELDPLNSSFYFRGSRFAWWAKDLATASTWMYKTLALSPGFTSAHANLAMILLEEGKAEAALQEASLEPEGGYRDWGLSIVYQALGRPSESLDALGRLEALGPQWGVQSALARAYCGYADAAFEWLEAARLEHDAGLCWLRHHAAFTNLHSDPRWAAFLTKMGLPV